jgi:hypothetical protein
MAGFSACLTSDTADGADGRTCQSATPFALLLLISLFGTNDYKPFGVALPLPDAACCGTDAFLAGATVGLLCVLLSLLAASLGFEFRVQSG